MCRAPLLAALALGATACAAATPPPSVAAAAPYRVVDLMPDFWRFWAQAEGQPLEAQAALFEAELRAAHPEAFAANVVGLDPTVTDFELRPQLLAWLPRLPARVPVMRRLSESVAKDLGAFDASFRAAFDDMAWSGAVYFTVSVDAFDGSVRVVNEQPTLLFGLDKIAGLHGASASLAPLFHHELFHLYHFDQIKDSLDASAPPRLYQALWAEGLAVYVAHVLNPQATWGQLVLNDEMVAYGEAHLPELAQELLQKMDSGDQETYRDFFRGSGKRPDMPVRMGYYVGMRVAQQLAKGRSLKALARIGEPAMRDEIAAALTALAAQ